MNEKSLALNGELESAVQAYEAAFAGYTRMHELRHPPPQPPDTGGADWLTLGALGVMVIASMVVSGSRTIAEFGGGGVGVAAFLMLELGIVAYGYIRTKRYYDEARHAGVKRLTTAGMFIALLVAVVSNIHATMKQNGVFMAPIFDVTILLLVAVAAPVLAFIAGDVFGMEAVAGAHRKAKAQREYAAALKEWRDGLNASWQASPLHKSVRVVRVDKDEPPPAPALSAVRPQADNGQTDGHGYGQGYSRQNDARTRVREYLDMHPEAIALTVRELAALAGAGKSVAAEVKAEYVKPNQEIAP